MFSQFDNEEVEAYFNRMNAQLKKMPPEDRAELHQEVRQHLDALAAAHEELGAPPREAAVAALRQFGDPKRIGRRMFWEWRIGTRRRLQGQGRKILVAGSLLSLLLPVGNMLPQPWQAHYNFFLLPLLFGSIAGLCFGLSAKRVVFRMLLFILTLIALINAYSVWWVGYGLGPTDSWWWGGYGFGLTKGFSWSYAFIWLPLGSLSAWLGGKAKERIDKRCVTTS